MRYIRQLALISSLAICLTAKSWPQAPPPPPPPNGNNTNQLNPATQIKWPENCNGTYVPATNTCVPPGTAANPGGGVLSCQLNGGGTFNGDMGACNIDPTNHVMWSNNLNSDRYTSNTANAIYTLQQALADAAGQGGRVIHNTAYTVTSPLQVGSMTPAIGVSLILNRISAPLTIGSGGGFHVCNGSNVEGPVAFGANGNQTIAVQAGATITDVFAPCKYDSTQEAMGLSHLHVSMPNTTPPTGVNFAATVTSGSNTLTNITSLPVNVNVGTIITGPSIPYGTLVASITGTAPPYSIGLTQPATANDTSVTAQGAVFRYSAIFAGTEGYSLSATYVNAGYGFLFDNGVYTSGAFAGTGAYGNDFGWINYRAWGIVQGNHSGMPVIGIVSWPGTHGGAGIANWNGFNGDAEGCSTGFPLFDINGNSGGNGGGNVQNIYNIGLDLEHKALCNGIHINDAHMVEMLNSIDTANSTHQTAVTYDNMMQAAVYIDETKIGSTDMVHVTGRNANAGTTVMDWVSSKGWAYLTAAASVGCTSITLSGSPVGVDAPYPMAYSPIKLLDGQQSEILIMAPGYTSGNTIPVMAPGCKYAHPVTATYVAWEPVMLDGGGGGGVYSYDQAVAGNAVNDGTGIITYTVTDPNVYETHHMGEWLFLWANGADAAHFSFGQARLTGLGQYCTSNTGAQITCANNQFQVKVADTTAGTNATTLDIFRTIAYSFDYRVGGDLPYGQNRGVYTHLPEINNSLELRDSAHPVHLSVANFDVDQHAFYSRLFFGYGKNWGNQNSLDAWLTTRCSLFCGALHVSSGITAAPAGGFPLYLGANDIDDYYIPPSDGIMREVVTTNPVAAVSGPTTVGNMAVYSGPHTVKDGGPIPTPASVITGPVTPNHLAVYADSTHIKDGGAVPVVPSTITQYAHLGVAGCNLANPGSYATCTDTITWPVPFSDTNYGYTCFGVDPVGSGSVALTLSGTVTNKTTAHANVVTQTLTTGTNQHFSDIQCNAVHN